VTSHILRPPLRSCARPEPPSFFRLPPQNKIYDAGWEPYRLGDWVHYTLRNAGLNLTGVTYYHYGAWYSIDMNNSYPYNFYNVPKVMTLSSFDWVAHTYANWLGSA
jgi:hypothetical protein